MDAFFDYVIPFTVVATLVNAVQWGYFSLVGAVAYGHDAAGRERWRTSATFSAYLALVWFVMAGMLVLVDQVTVK